MKKFLFMVLFSTASVFMLNSSILASGEDKSGIPIQDFSLTISPVHLLISTVELNGEFNIANKFGIAAIGAIGNPEFTIEYSDGTKENKKFMLYEIGGQLIGYPIGTFRHGLQLGLETMYLDLSGNDDDVELNGRGLSAGGFVGYKFISRRGFTFCAQIGYQKIFVEASANDSSSESSASDSDSGVLLNLNFGFSF